MPSVPNFDSLNRHHPGRPAPDRILPRDRGLVQLHCENASAPELSAILDLPAIQSLMNDFYAISHIPMAVIDITGRVLAGVGWQEICTDFHRVNPESCRNCFESDIQLSKGILPGEYRLYKCKNNMWDVATPLMVGEHHLGNIFSGQFFFDDEQPDRELFRAQARTYGFDEQKYMAALEAVPHLSRQIVQTGMVFMTKLAHLLSAMSYSNIELGRSITERKQTESALSESEERLRRSEERLRAATTAAGIGVWHWRPGTSYVEVTANWRNLFGVAPDLPVTFETWSGSLHPEDRERAINELNIASDEHREFNTEYRIVRPDGTIRWVVDRGGARYDENGRAVSMAGVNVDITQQKLAQQALIRSEKLASVGRMAATVAHEINNPLEAVTNCIYLAKSSAELPYLTRENLDLAEQELQRVAHITSQTLGFYRENTKRAVVDVDKLVREVSELYGPKLRQKELRLEVEHRGDTEIVAVSGEIRQVISNLLTNAVDASSSQQKVHIRSSRVTLNGTTCIRLTVADTGVGIPRSDFTRLFDPFFTTKEAVGTGLGLWVSNEIVVKHGGYIRVRSIEGKGSVFSVFLPKC
jgi:PAS domain S-box-containing protein